MSEIDRKAMHDVTSAARSIATPAMDGRAAWLDVGRLVAMTSVVWLHAMDSSVLQRFGTWSGVPMFCAAAVFLVFGWPPGRPRRTPWNYAVMRFNRIYVPFIGWTIIYAASRFTVSLFLHNETHAPELSAWMFLIGSTHHLWFLPHILVSCLVAYAVARWASQRASVVILISACLMMGGVVLSLYAESLGKLIYPQLRLFLYAVPSTAWGIALGYLASRFGIGWLRHRRTSGLALAIFAAALAAQWTGTSRSMLMTNLCGVGLFVACLAHLNLPPVARRVLTPLGGLAYGGYLAHVLLVEGLQDVMTAMRWHEGVVMDVTVFTSSLVGALAIAYLLRQSRFTAWLSP